MIEVGEYVRTKNKGIKRIDRIDNNKTVNKYLYFTGIEDFEGKEYKIIKTTDIVKHSKQLIDLIEVGDYVNGKKVIMDLKQSKEWYKAKDDFVTCKDYTFSNEEIVTIITKEQYEANCYKVKEEIC